MKPGSPATPRNGRKTKSTRPKRPFTPLPLSVVGHQARQKRCVKKFSIKNRPDEESVPYFKPWRLNLTELSRKFNLYFAAIGKDVHVYEPQYPTQALGHEPCYKLTTPVSAPNLRGHFPYSDSHCINRILVESLGNEEILVMACDDGDVLAYRTRSIMDHITSAKHKTDHFDLSMQRLKPIFHRNVGGSAWGLAVNSAARMIAVSANTTQVTVFAFALVDTSPSQQTIPLDTESVNNDTQSSTTQAYEEWRRYNVESDLLLFHKRRQNLIFVHEEHKSNIPSVSFCDLIEDPLGKFVVSTDISGLVVIYDLEKQSKRCVYSCNQYPEIFDPVGGGWGVMCLDRRAFRKAPNLEGALGSFHETRSTGASRRAYWDCTSSRRLVHDSGPWVPSDENGQTSTDTAITTSSELLSDTNSEFSNNNSPASGLSPYIQTSDSEYDVSIPTDYSLSTFPHPGDRDNNSALFWPTTHFNIETFPTTILPSHPRTHSSPPSRNDIKSPLLLMNPQSIHLFQESVHDSVCGPEQGPIIYLLDPLEQDAPFEMCKDLDSLDRMNLNVQIPELGVVLAGSPKGRVAVFTLHQTAMPTSRRPIYTMRLDHILPLNSQERRQQRPLMQLVGVSAAPLQGYSRRKSSANTTGKWRVMLTYIDQSVLSYEIGGTNESVII